MSAPAVSVRLVTGGTTTVWLTDYLSQESVPTVTEAIEKPAETNAFVAPEVSLRGHDTSGLPIWTILRGLDPLGGDNVLTIFHDYGTASEKVVFTGYVAANTVQWDDQERVFSFTAFGLGQAFANIDATPSFQRDNLTGWTVVSHAYTDALATSGMSLCVITSGTVCPFAAGDQLQFTVLAETYDETVVSVADAGSGSYNVYILDPQQLYPTGTPITCLTPYYRNARIEDVVDEAFALGLPGATVHFDCSGASSVSSYFASPLPTTGLPDVAWGASCYLDGLDQKPMVGSGAYGWQQDDPPTSDWTSAGDSGSQPPIDWTTVGDGTVQLYGIGWDQVIAGTISTFSWYAYRMDVYPYERWRLEIETEHALPRTWEVRLRKQTSPDGHTWGADVVPTGWTDDDSTTSTNLVTYLKQGSGGTGDPSRTCGIAYDPNRQTVYFTAPYSVGAGAVGWRLSSYVCSTSTVNLGIVTGRRGACVVPTVGMLTVWTCADPGGGTPTVYVYATTVGGGVSATGSFAVDGNAQPHTARYRGDLSDLTYLIRTTAGVTLTSVGGALDAAQLLSGATSGLAFTWLDRGTSGYAAVLVAGGVPWWIDTTASQVIAYVDAEGITLGDVLTQCAVVLDAVWYVDAEGECWFRTRQIASGQAIGADATLDGETVVSARRQALWYKTYRYVRCTQDGDDTVYGEAGDTGFRGGVMGLEITSRFVAPASYARAIAEHIFDYLGRGLQFLDLQLEDDGRDYQIGKTFTRIVDGASKTFQIVEVQRTLLSAVLRVQAVEL